MSSWKSSNYDQPIPEVGKSFSIICPKETDLWEKAPATHRSNAPHIYSTTTAGAFKSATVSVQGEWTYQYDQGGLCIFVNLKDGSRKWIKTGVEFLDGQPFVSVVAKDRWSDWSLRPPPTSQSQAVRIRIETHSDGSLWVYVIDGEGKKQPMREVTWWGELDDDTEIFVGPAAAKPSKEGGSLVVNFSDFELETS